jgi:hypothetical protein
MSTTRHEPTREDPLHPAEAVGPAQRADIARTRQEIAETMSEVVTRATELPNQARMAARRGMVHPATLVTVAVIVAMVFVLWRIRQIGRPVRPLRTRRGQR